MAGGITIIGIMRIGRIIGRRPIIIPIGNIATGTGCTPAGAFMGSRGGFGKIPTPITVIIITGVIITIT